MNKFLRGLGRFVGFFPKTLGFLVQLIPALIILSVVACLAVLIYTSTPFVILGTWLAFLGEGKFTQWATRAAHDAKVNHGSVKTMIRGIFS